MMALTRSDSRRRSDAIHFRLIYIATFPACLLAAFLTRLVRPRGGLGRSIIGEAKASARTCGSFALMG